MLNKAKRKPDMKHVNETSSNPNQIINELMITIDELRDVYIRENEALDQSNPNKFMELQDEKARKAQRYQFHMQDILKRKEKLRKADPSLKQKLQAMQEDFAALTEKNLNGLKRMQRCTERLSGRLRNATKEKVKKDGSFAYGETGLMNSAAHKAVSIAISETA